MAYLYIFLEMHIDTRAMSETGFTILKEKKDGKKE